MTELRHLIELSMHHREEMIEQRLTAERQTLSLIRDMQWLSFGVCMCALTVGVSLSIAVSNKEFRTKSDLLVKMLVAARQSTRVKMAFLNSCSHELRTPSQSTALSLTVHKRTVSTLLTSVNACLCDVCDCHSERHPVHGTHPRVR